MLSTVYQVVITNTLTNTSTSAGFIDHKKIEQYIYDGTPPSTYTLSKDKERANVRYKTILEKLQSMGNLYASNCIANAATANTAANTFTMTLEVERGDSVLYTRDENIANGLVELSGTSAIKRCVARALAFERLGLTTEIPDPTQTTAPGNGNTVAAYVRMSSRIESIDIGALANVSTAEGAITVTKLV